MFSPGAMTVSERPYGAYLLQIVEIAVPDALSGTASVPESPRAAPSPPGGGQGADSAPHPQHPRASVSTR